MTVGEWLEWVKADATKRGMPELIGPLEGLAPATERLRAADWNDDADKATPIDFAQGKPVDVDPQTEAK
jgi:hypothetical protein